MQPYGNSTLALPRPHHHSSHGVCQVQYDTLPLLYCIVLVAVLWVVGRGKQKLYNPIHHHALPLATCTVHPPPSHAPSTIHTPPLNTAVRLPTPLP